MAYDEALAERFRAALARRKNITEKRMMGGVCFLVNGNMIGGADRNKSGAGRFMFRVGKDNAEAAEALPGAEQMVQGGRKMSGFFFRWTRLVIRSRGMCGAMAMRIPGVKYPTP